MIHFVGAGPGAVDLITVRGAELLKRASTVVYAGSLVNPALLSFCPPSCVVLDSASMSLDEIILALQEGEARGGVTVRLHTGDPCLWGAIREQMDRLDELGISYDVVPGVSSFCAASAALRAELTRPGVSQSVILARQAGRTPVPDGQRLSDLARCGSTMVLFLSAGLAKEAVQELLDAGLPGSTPACAVYKASWPDERTAETTLDDLAGEMARLGMTKTTMILVGGALSRAPVQTSLLYDRSFGHGYRKSEE